MPTTAKPSHRQDGRSPTGEEHAGGNQTSGDQQRQGRGRLGRIAEIVASTTRESSVMQVPAHAPRPTRCDDRGRCPWRDGVGYSRLR